MDLDNASVQVFYDASKSSYASDIFFRGVCEVRAFNHLLAAKSRVVPLNKISIPCLEHLPAMIGNRFFVPLKVDLIIDSKTQVYFWSNSITVLSLITHLTKSGISYREL